MSRPARVGSGFLNAASIFAGIILIFTGLARLHAQQKIVWSAQEQPIADQLRTLRKVPDADRAAVTLRLAGQIAKLPAGPHKLSLASTLASLSTEGDYGLETLQQVALTLAQAVREQPPGPAKGQPAMEYMELAQLVRYEHVKLSLNAAQFRAALSKLEETDKIRQEADFKLPDLGGNVWQLKKLQGKVVLVNFWATWCPPCRKEMPDMEALYQRFKPQGLVILAISDEEEPKVSQFIAEHRIDYPVLLDAGRKVNDLFQVEGIPKSFVFDRQGKLVAQAIDMRTQGQFLDMLRQAGLN